MQRNDAYFYLMHLPESQFSHIVPQIKIQVHHTPIFSIQAAFDNVGSEAEIFLSVNGMDHSLAKSL